MVRAAAPRHGGATVWKPDMDLSMSSAAAVEVRRSIKLAMLKGGAGRTVFCSKGCGQRWQKAETTQISFHHSLLSNFNGLTALSQRGLSQP